jgi:tetratricopeptide (TPR) repeat protein
MRLHDDASHASARECLEYAIELDPDYAEAWAYLAYLYREEYHHNRNAEPDSLQRAARALNQAVELDRNHPMVASAQAMITFSQGDNVSGLVHAERAVELNTSNATILATVAIYYAQLGRTREAVVLADRVLDMHPTPPHWLHMTFATAHYLEGEFQACLAAVARWNQDSDVQWHYHRAAALAQLGRPAEAAAAVDQIRTRFPAFAVNPATEIRKYLLVPETAEPFLDGLERAGLDTNLKSGDR